MTDDSVTVGDGASIERFDAFMERCLYGADGFYATTGTAGRRGGDFITSPEVGPLFGAVLAAALDNWWEVLGRPDPFPVYDVGCGPGALLKSVAVARPDRPWQLIGVDRVDSAGADLSDLPDDLTGAAVVANELLDNLPFRVVERTEDGWSEVFVADSRTGPQDRERTVQEVLIPVSVPTADGDVPKTGGGAVGDGHRELLVRLEEVVPVGARLPLLDSARDWVTSVLDRNPAVLCLFDYGASTTAELGRRGGWLRTYRDHQRGADPLVHPGRSDITTDIAWDQLPTPDGLERQDEWLARWGIQALVEEGREHWKASAHAPDLTAFRMRSRISEAEALLDDGGLGRWWVAFWENGRN